MISKRKMPPVPASLVQHKMRENVREKCHSFGVAQAAILDCEFQQIDHPSLNPDITHSDYYLFICLKKTSYIKLFYPILRFNC